MVGVATKHGKVGNVIFRLLQDRTIRLIGIFSVEKLARTSLTGELQATGSAILDKMGQVKPIIIVHMTVARHELVR